MSSLYNLQTINNYDYQYCYDKCRGFINVFSKKAIDFHSWQVKLELNFFKRKSLLQLDKLGGQNLIATWLAWARSLIKPLQTSIKIIHAKVAFPWPGELWLKSPPLDFMNVSYLKKNVHTELYFLATVHKSSEMTDYSQSLIKLFKVVCFWYKLTIDIIVLVQQATESFKLFCKPG